MAFGLIAIKPRFLFEHLSCYVLGASDLTVNESCHTYESAISNVWMDQGARVYSSLDT